MKIGDSVSVIDEDMDGIITSVIGGLVTIRDAHGFTHQYPKEKLVIKNASIYENVPVIKKHETLKPISKKHYKKHQILDLHFELLVKNPTEYDSSERLLIQKQKLIDTLNYCRRSNLKKLEIIHGIGDGVLQEMVFDYLSGQTGIEFENHHFFYHQRGSVMVTLK